MGQQTSKPADPVAKASKAVEKAVDKTDKAVDKTSKDVSKAADKASDKVADKVTETLNIFQKKVAPPPPKKAEKNKVVEALPVVGVIALVAAGAAYLWKTKPWKKGGDKPAAA